MDLVLAMGEVLLTWIIALAVIYGIGVLVLRALRIPLSIFPFAAGWAGTCAVLAVLQLVHFFLPMGPWLIWMFFIIGAAGLALNVKETRLPRTVGPEVLSIILAAIWMANLASGRGNWIPYDTGFYHASMVKWFSEYPIVPGLANLHGPLALNPSSLLFAAAIDTGAWRERAHHLFCGIWVLLALSWLAAEIAHARRAGKAAYAYFAAALLPVMLGWLLGSTINGFATDPPAIVLTFVCFSACLRLLLEDYDGPTTRRLLLFAMAAGFTAITCKLIALVPVVAALAITSLVLWRRKRIEGFRWYLAGKLALVLLILAPWAARNVIMSGYLIHPVPQTAMPVSWRMPTEKAVEQQAWVRSWSRIPNEFDLSKTQGWKWIGHWTSDVVQTHWGDLLTPIALVIVAIALAIRQQSFTRNWILLLAPTLGLAFWFVNAPDVRYGGFMIALALGLLLAMQPAKTARLVAIASLAIYCGMITLQLIRSSPQDVPDGDPRKLFIYLPGDSNPPLPPMPRPPCEQLQTSSGLVVNVPVHGNRSYAATLPAAPTGKDIDPNLRLRDPPFLAGGFEIANHK